MQTQTYTATFYVFLLNLYDREDSNQHMHTQRKDAETKGRQEEKKEGERGGERRRDTAGLVVCCWKQSAVK